MKEPSSKNKGFTLLELIIAVFILTVAIVGGYLVFAQIMKTTFMISSRLTAAYLAQEGIEIIRNMRDTNWLDALDWDNGIGACSSGCQVDYKTGAGGETADCSASYCSGFSYSCGDITNGNYCEQVQGCLSGCHDSGGNAVDFFIGPGGPEEMTNYDCAMLSGSCAGPNNCYDAQNDPFSCNNSYHGICNNTAGTFVCHDCEPDNCQPQWDEVPCGAHGGIISPCDAAPDSDTCHKWECDEGWQGCAWTPANYTWYGTCSGSGQNYCFAISDPTQCDSAGACNWISNNICNPDIPVAYSGAPLNLDSDGFYSYSSGSPTQFKRKITVLAIDSNILRVSAEVYWEDRGSEYNIEVQEDLYNWR